ncbi:flavonol synthase 1 [Perilla frutescens var. hirtella]|uniref:Flavonol synthase 1 n=1 Tax=Perilla frutescens var. hirtella TaxID=608512 RepID=A0AAD4PAJ7_PERFH|nr:flavonol synthase 1 [Perilla frutescens var. hirtella]
MGEEKLQTHVASICNDEELPPEFIRPENEQPRFTTFQGAPAEVPVVDFASENVVQSVYEASSKWGLFQIVNHSIPVEVIENLQRVGRQFFELSNEEKVSYGKDPDSNNIDGYGTKLRNGWVDHLFNKISPPSAVDYRFWPKNPPDYREVTEEYGKHLHEVVEKLLRWLSEGLGMAAEELKTAVGGEELVYNMKINYYPRCPRPEVALGVPAHTDLCALTVLVPNEILSNGKYKAVLHRSVVNKEKTRMSWPVFMEPPPNLEIGPLPTLLNEENPPKFKTKKFGDYAYCKLNKIPQ